MSIRIPKPWILMVILIALLLPALAFAATTKQERLVKQNGTTANPDSAVAAADTSSAFQLEKTLSSLYFTVAADTTVIYEVLVSPDGVHWFSADKDTTPAVNAIETTADLGPIYAGWYCRLIQTAAAAKPFGRGVVTQIK